jgi:alginate O-acetyltransferase complex protein AlgI
MLLHTPAYFLFLAVIVPLYWLLPEWRGRKALLLGASYAFYATIDLRFAALLFALTVIVYLLGRAIPGNPRGRLYAWLSAAASLAVLCAFKYAAFFVDNLGDLLRSVGISFVPPALQLLLPVGISFYTFQAISYTTEIYRKKASPAASFLNFAIYLAFFPKLIAGPLVRPRAFLSQLEKPPPPLRGDRLRQALGLALLGLVKKVLIADSIAAQADTAFRAALLPLGDGRFASPLYLQGFYLYAFQIYADFSGYTDLARASALFLGFELPENFRQPYLASSVAAFWNCWHMTLTQWFREYLFFPLSRTLLTASGRRFPRVSQVTAILVTMALVGLWHGAAWTFVAWGLWHGFLLSVERVLDRKPPRGWRAVLGTLATFHLVGVGWVIFGAGSFGAAVRFLGGLTAFDQMTWLPVYLPSVMLAGGLLLALDLGCSGRFSALGKRWRSWQPVLVIAAIVVLAALMLLDAARGTGARPFIYGQF